MQGRFQEEWPALNQCWGKGAQGKRCLPVPQLMPQRDRLLWGTMASPPWK